MLTLIVTRQQTGTIEEYLELLSSKIKLKPYRCSNPHSTLTAQLGEPLMYLPMQESEPLSRVKLRSKQVN